MSLTPNEKVVMRENLMKAILAASVPISDAVHRHELETILQRIKAGDGCFAFSGMEEFHPKIINVGMILGGYPRGARDPSFKNRYLAELASIVDGAKARSVEATLDLVWGLQSRICSETPEIKF